MFWKLQLLIKKSTSFQLFRTRIPRTRAKYGKANFITLADEDEDTDEEEEEEEENIRAPTAQVTDGYKCTDISNFLQNTIIALVKCACIFWFYMNCTPMKENYYFYLFFLIPKSRSNFRLYM